MCGKRAGARRDFLLACQGSANRQGWNGQPVTREEHDDAEGGVIERRVNAQTSKGAAVVGGGRGEGIQNLTEAMRRGVEITCLASGCHYADGGPYQGGEDRDQQDQRSHFHLIGLDLFTQV